MRDWSKDGAEERVQCYGVMLKELKKRFPLSMEERQDIRVLVPGSGLGRLVWECANLGYETQGNEFSYFMLLCSYLILNCCDRVDQWTIFPFIFETKNLYSFDDQIRGITVPDVLPSDLPKTANFSMAAGDFLEVYGPRPKDWHCVMTCFFLDTANNVLQYMRTISRILKDGGYWINFGPLLYHYADMADELSIELTYEEIKAAMPAFGFELVNEQLHLPANYTTDVHSMFKQSYDCVFFTCKKVSDMKVPDVKPTTNPTGIPDPSPSSPSKNKGKSSESEKKRETSDNEKKK